MVLLGLSYNFTPVATQPFRNPGWCSAPWHCWPCGSDFTRRSQCTQLQDTKYEHWASLMQTVQENKRNHHVALTWMNKGLGRIHPQKALTYLNFITLLGLRIHRSSNRTANTLHTRMNSSTPLVDVISAVGDAVAPRYITRREELHYITKVDTTRRVAKSNKFAKCQTLAYLCAARGQVAEGCFPILIRYYTPCAISCIRSSTAWTGLSSVAAIASREE